MTLFGVQPMTGGFTVTSLGEIPHKRTIWRGYPVDAPVKLNFLGAKSFDRSLAPMRDGRGALLYALPCGGEISG